MRTSLIALDWGTTTLRAYRFDRQGLVLQSKILPHGIMRLPTDARSITGQLCHDGFEVAFDLACGDWLIDAPQCAVIACGMVGSAQGWLDAGYLETPSDLLTLAKQLKKCRSVQGVDVHIVPGIIQRSGLPNVMRGEETQVFGALLLLDEIQRGQPWLIGLPGSHSKWVQVANQRIHHFDTFMTGEVFAALQAHTILGRTSQADAPFMLEAFARGVALALSPQGQTGMLATIFSTRTLGLLNELDAAQQTNYLSGLLIGYELLGLSTAHGSAAVSLGDMPILLIGDAQLCERYQAALAIAGCKPATLVEQATPHGLWQLARHAGLVD